MCFFSKNLGESLAKVIMDNIKGAGVDMALCRGQSYDGASNMSGAIRGCAAVIMRDYPKAIYGHCHSHILNLSVMKACTIVPEIRK